MVKTLIRLVAAALVLSWSAVALAQSPRPRIFDRCEVIFPPVVLGPAYDPMSPDDYYHSFTTTANRAGSGDDGEDARGMDYNAVLLEPGNFRLPIELFVLDTEGGATGDVLYNRPGPAI